MTDKQAGKIFLKLIKKVKKEYTVTLPKDAMRGELPIEDVIRFKIHYKFIFDHDFAKALWGDRLLHKHTLQEPVFDGKRLYIDSDDYLPNYLIKLAEMVQSKDYLEYLSQYCD